MKKALIRVVKMLAALLILGAAVVAGLLMRSPTLSADRLEAIENRVWDNAYTMAADSGLTRAVAAVESLEAAGGRPYLTLLDEEVVQPAGLKGTGADDVTRDIPS